MAARKPATAAEILEALQSHPSYEADRAVPFWTAIQFLSLQLRTTRKRAKAWIVAATEEDVHPFEMVGTRGGKIVHVARGEHALLLSEAGYAESDDVAIWPGLTTEGEIVQGFTDSDNDEFLISAELLREMCKHAASFQRRQREVEKAKKVKQDEVIRQRYGDDLAYVRGLLKLANVDVEKVDAGATHNLNSDETYLSLLFQNESITHLAEVLAAHGIE